MLLNKSITLADIEAVDPDLHQSLTWMLNNCIEIKEDGQGMSLIFILLRFSDFYLGLSTFYLVSLLN